MRSIRSILTATGATLVVSGLLVTGALASSNSAKTPSMAGMTTSSMTAETLRVALDNLFGEHAVLAMNATNAGVTGSKSLTASCSRPLADAVQLFPLPTKNSGPLSPMRPIRQKQGAGP